MNNEAALKLLFMGLTVLTEAAATVAKINATIQQARAEGRDISDEELNALAAATGLQMEATADALQAVIDNG